MATLEREATGRVVGSRGQVESTRVQIAKVDGRGAVIEVNDMLDSDPKLSKVQFVLVHYDTSTNKETASARHWMDADTFKAVARVVQAGQYEDGAIYVDRKGSERAGVLEARVLSIRFQPDQKLPFRFVLQNGPGETIGRGAVKQAPGTTWTTDLMIALSRWDMLTLMGDCLDYVRDWELRHFKERQAARSITRMPIV